MATEIKERVDVVAVFSGGVEPIRFKWKGRVYPVSEITYRWKTTRGATTIMHFSVTDGGTLFELAFDTEFMRWSLERVEA